MRRPTDRRRLEPWVIWWFRMGRQRVPMWTLKMDGTIVRNKNVRGYPPAPRMEGRALR